MPMYPGYRTNVDGMPRPTQDGPTGIPGLTRHKVTGRRQRLDFCQESFNRRQIA
ncbi:hypothetical protein DACRYDRAFT_25223 [Dacryopinax primogenitus]|uniref:Uncharacterized protein n=1 Tax=Dacryopinax primogenitus (strain DJM 731) TaxID=1858805 RepID=M5FQQ1_DACPD|nr:uncharacterized protein DACRYDRAFT_25223 [Dacryopinax primogenitus]EJT97094.1 hypothetical protein DACRYDRAFT_25223 [Dacryopinax primogenitus]